MKAVIFDMDGVIFDSERLVVSLWNDVAQKYHIENMDTVIRLCLGVNETRTREILSEHYGTAFPYDRYKKEVSLLFHQISDHGRLPKKPGITELLSFLKAHHIKTAVASSTKSSTVRQELSEGGLLPFFDTVIGGDMVSKSKPEPDIFLKACESLLVDPSDAYIIEDSYNGIRAAYLSGARPLMVPDLMPVNAEMQEKAYRIFPSLVEVTDYFQTLVDLPC